jgi:hypothetical protein
MVQFCSDWICLLRGVLHHTPSSNNFEGQFYSQPFRPEISHLEQHRSHNSQSQQLEPQVKINLAPTTNMSDLQILSKVEIGGYELKNRVVLAPLTRAR